MSTPDVKSNHIGRKIVRIREIRGVKQETLAAGLGISQQAVSKMEQSEDVEDEKLKRVAEILGVTVDTIRNFSEEAMVNNIQNTFHDNAVQNQFNPIEKLVVMFEENKKLYERLLDSERKKNELLESLLKKRNGEK